MKKTVKYRCEKAGTCPAASDCYHGKPHPTMGWTCEKGACSYAKCSPTCHPINHGSPKPIKLGDVAARIRQDLGAGGAVGKDWRGGPILTTTPTPQEPTDPARGGAPKAKSALVRIMRGPGKLQLIVAGREWLLVEWGGR